MGLRQHPLGISVSYNCWLVRECVSTSCACVFALEMTFAGWKTGRHWECAARNACLILTWPLLVCSVDILHLLCVCACVCVRTAQHIRASNACYAQQRFLGRLRLFATQQRGQRHGGGGGGRHCDGAVPQRDTLRISHALSVTVSQPAHWQVQRTSPMWDVFALHACVRVGVSGGLV